MKHLTLWSLLLSAVDLCTANNSGEPSSSVQKPPDYVQFYKINERKCNVSFRGSPNISLTNVKSIYNSFKQKLKLESTSERRFIDSLSFNGFIINQEAAELIDTIICDTCTYVQKTFDYSPQLIQNGIDTLNATYTEEKKTFTKNYIELLEKSRESVKKSFKENCDEFNKINEITDRNDLLSFFENLLFSYYAGLTKPSIYFCSIIKNMFTRKIANIISEINQRIESNESLDEIKRAVTFIFYENIDNVLASFGLKMKPSDGKSGVQMLEDKKNDDRPVSIFMLQSLICDFMKRGTKKKNSYLKKHVDCLIENSDYFQKQFEDIIKKSEIVDIDKFFELLMKELRQIITKAEMLIEVNFQSCSMEKGWNANSQFLKVDATTEIISDYSYENTITINGKEFIIKVTKDGCREIAQQRN